MNLSQMVRGFIDDYDRDVLGEGPEERAEKAEAQQMIEVIVDDLIKSRKTLTDSRLESLEEIVKNQPDLTRDFLDERFTKDAVDEVPGRVTRLLQLSRLRATRIPSGVTNGYLGEAAHTYILGLPQASVALSRAALEAALKEEIGYQPNTFLTMNKLLKNAEASGVIDRAHRELARQVADAGNDVLHEKPTTLPNAYEVLIAMRGVLEHIYSDD